MTPELRNRLVGLIIIFASGIIFIPNILDGKKETFKDDFKTIPDRPEFKSVAKINRFPEQEFQEKIAQVKTPIDTDVALDDTSSADTPAQNTPAQAQKEKTESIEITKPATSDSAVVKTGVIAKANTPKAEPAQPVVSKSNNEAYVVQLGSFRHKANVKTLEDKLHKAGYITFTRPIKTQSGWLTKVFVGPELNEVKLTEELPQLKALTGVSGKVTRYQPAK
ncbi:SPOR domain-containing protein [Flocculibacter collagenilyticus]|uniref:SPOR domain-containing protein n=1 Tax=Flocculibacter collagenilyticus TaxID=2744479 RepID=UPI0018F520AD|nr:SPOR domain-containing protein [Flocculibacter collagenilyticus]